MKHIREFDLLAVPLSFFLGGVLLILNRPLGLAPLGLALLILLFRDTHTRVKSDHSLALEALQKRMEAYEAQLATTAKAQTQTQTELVSLRNSTRPVGGWVK